RLAFGGGSYGGPATPCGSYNHILDSPRTAGGRSQARLAFGGGSHGGPATPCGLVRPHPRLASDGGAPAPRRPAASYDHILDPPRTAGPPPRDALRLVRPHSLAHRASPARKA